MSDCPSDDDLTGFLNESLPPDKITILSEHVDGCATCQDRLDTLTHDTDGAVARYKDLSSIMTPTTGPQTSGGGGISSPDAGTLILGGTPLMVPQLSGLPHVPGFDVAAEIGRGGMGVVYRARHRRLNRLVALKMILAGGAADTRTVQRFLFEAEILARVQHPQVVQVFEVDTYQGPSGVPIPYLAIELLEGGSLSQRLKSGGRLEPRASAELMEGIARAVHAAHAQGVVHRDLKPGNILFPAAGGQQPAASEEKKEATIAPSSPSSIHSSLAPKVTDFGLAKFTEAGADLTGSGQVVGTPHYMAPEQAAGNKQIGPPADVYALGAILFECLTGRTPFQGSEPMSVLLKVVSELPPDVRTLRPEVPRDLGAVVMRCLEKDARRRYASADELANDLRRFLENRPTKARPVTGRERLWLWTKRNPVVAGLLTTLAVVLLAGFGAVTYLWAQERQAAIDARLATDLSKIAQRRSDEAHKGTAKALEQVEHARTNADLQRAHLEFARAVDWCEEGRIDEGLEYFVRAIELAEATDAPDLARVARMNLAAWRREIPPIARALSHSNQPRMAAFLPDGKHIVTAGRGGGVFLWDTATGRKIRTYKPARRIHNWALDYAYPVLYWAVDVSPDGKTIAAGGGDGQITVWDVGPLDGADEMASRATVDAIDKATRDLASTGTPGVRATDNIWALAFAPDGTLWANDGAGAVKRWDVTARPRPKLLAHAVLPAGRPFHILQAVAVSPDGKRVFTGDRAGIVREWDAVENREVRVLAQVNGWISDVAVSPDGARVAFTGTEGRVQTVPLVAGIPAIDLGLTGTGLGGAYGNGIAFAQKQPFLLASDTDGNVRVWHRDTGQPIGIPYRFFGEVTKIRFRPGSDEFAVPAGSDLFLCKTPEPPVDVLFAGRGQRARGMDFSPGGLLAVTDDRLFSVFDPRTGKRLQSVFGSGDDPLTIHFDPNPTRQRVFRGYRGGVDDLAVPGGVRTTPFPILGSGKSTGRIHQIDFFANGTRMVAMDTDAVYLLDPVARQALAIGRPRKVANGVELRALAAHPLGHEVLVAVANRVTFMDPKTLAPLSREWQTGAVVIDAMYTPDGKRVMLGRADNMAELRDVQTGELVGRQMPHGRAVVAVAVSPDGKYLLTGSRDGTARFWDAETGLPIGAPLRHYGPVTHVAFAPDREHIATATGTGALVLWDVPPPAAKGDLDELCATIRKKSDPAPVGN